MPCGAWVGAAGGRARAPGGGRFHDALRVGLDSGERRRGRAHGHLASVRRAIRQREADRGRAWHRRLRWRDEANRERPDRW